MAANVTYGARTGSAMATIGTTGAPTGRMMAANVTTGSSTATVSNTGSLVSKMMTTTVTPRALVSSTTVANVTKGPVPSTTMVPYVTTASLTGRTVGTNVAQVGKTMVTNMTSGVLPSGNVMTPNVTRGALAGMKLAANVTSGTVAGRTIAANVTTGALAGTTMIANVTKGVLSRSTMAPNVTSEVFAGRTMAFNMTTGAPPSEEDYYFYGEPACLERGTGDAEQWAREAVRLLLSTAILLSNAFIVAAVLRLWAREGRPLGARAAASFLVLNLAAADALFGFAMVYGWLQDVVCALYEQMAARPFSCMLSNAMSQIFDSTSSVTIVVIALDRVMSVSHTARCRNFLTPRRAMGAIAGSWLLGFLLAMTVFMIPGAYSWKQDEGCMADPIYEETMLWGTVGVLLATLFGCYWRIHLVTLRMLRRGSLPSARGQASTKAARMLLLIFAWDACAYFPLLIVTLIRACGGSVSEILKDVASNLTLLTFLADPYIYAYNNQQTKKAITDLLKCLNWRSRRIPVIDEPPTLDDRRRSFNDNSLTRFRQVISTITNSSSASDEEGKNKSAAKRTSFALFDKLSKDEKT